MGNEISPLWGLFVWAIFVGAQEYNVRDFGAVGDGVTNDTLAIKAALTAAYNSNGGRVIFDANYTFLTAPLDITSNVIMDIRGEILGSSTPKDYYVVPGDPWWRSWGPTGNHPLIQTNHTVNVTFTGGGIINGAADKLGAFQPFTLVLLYTNDSTVENITLYNCPRWTLNLGLCDNIHINYVNITNALSPNMMTWGDGISNDGYDITCSTNVLLENSYYKGGDNAIYINTPDNGFPTSENITIRNMVVVEGGCIGSGIGTNGPRNVTFDNITLINMEFGICATAGYIDGMTFSNIQMINVNITAVIGGSNVSNIVLENITNDMSGVIANWRNPPIWDFFGGSSAQPLVNLTMRNITILNSKPGRNFYGKCDFISGYTCENVYPFCPCLYAPLTWDYFNETNSSYAFVPQSLVYNDAENFCVQNGGHLASIHSNFENNYILSLVNQTMNAYPTTYINPEFWIGFFSADNQNFEWTDGSAVNFLTWSKNAPTYDFNPCVYMNSNASDAVHFSNWIDYNNCTTTNLPFVCKMSGGNNNSPNATKSIPAVPWAYNNQTNAYYMLVTTWLNSSTAENRCVAAGGHLTSILSSTENSVITRLANQAYNASDYGNPSFWIGYYSTNNQTFQWSDGSASSYTNWVSTAPNTYFHPCAYINGNAADSVRYTYWSDYNPCSTSLPFICKLVLYPDQPIGQPL